MTATRRTAFTTAHGMVDRVHRNTAVMRTTAEPAFAPGFTHLDVAVPHIAQLPYGGTAIDMNLAYFTRRQAQLRPVAFFGQKLGTHARRTNHPAAATATR